MTEIFGVACFLGVGIYSSWTIGKGEPLDGQERSTLYGLGQNRGRERTTYMLSRKESPWFKDATIWIC